MLINYYKKGKSCPTQKKYEHHKQARIILPYNHSSQPKDSVNRNVLTRHLKSDSTVFPWKEHSTNGEPLLKSTRVAVICTSAFHSLVPYWYCGLQLLSTPASLAHTQEWRNFSFQNIWKERHHVGEDCSRHMHGCDPNSVPRATRWNRFEKHLQPHRLWRVRTFHTCTAILWKHKTQVVLARGCAIVAWTKDTKMITFQPWQRGSLHKEM